MSSGESTSKCSFPDLEIIGHKEKGQYLGKRGKIGLKKLGRDAFHKFIRMVN